MPSKPICLFFIAVMLAQTGCTTGGGHSISPSASYLSISSDASRVLPLRSNQDNTRFIVDGNPVGASNAGGELKILVNDQPHTITAEVPCYQTKEHFIQPPYDGVSPVSFYYNYKDVTCDDAVAKNEPQQEEGINKVPPITPAKIPSQDPSYPSTFGSYVALLIGNSRYEKNHYWSNLQTPEADAEELGKILESKYGFRAIRLINASRKQIIGAVNDLVDSADEKTNVLIYYAGHGHLVKEAHRGYWIAVDGEERNPANWVATDDITSALKAMRAKHVLVIADSCYSATLMRESRGLQRPSSESPDLYLAKMAQKKARLVMSSGGFEPVIDTGGAGNHSVFASALIDVLRESKDVIDGTLLFSQVRKKVQWNAKQTPEYSFVQETGHEGGDFFFIPQHRP